MGPASLSPQTARFQIDGLVALHDQLTARVPPPGAKQLHHCRRAAGDRPAIMKYPVQLVTLVYDNHGHPHHCRLTSADIPVLRHAAKQPAIFVNDNATDASDCRQTPGRGLWTASCGPLNHSVHRRMDRQKDGRRVLRGGKGVNATNEPGIDLSGGEFFPLRSALALTVLSR